MKTIEERFNEKINFNGPIPAAHPELGPCHIWTAGKFHTGYGKFSIAHKSRRSHKVAWMLANRFIPEGMCLDHFACGNHLCVNPNHLRLASNQQNSYNRSKVLASSNLKGASYNRRDNNYRATLKVNGIGYNLGSYDTAEEAHLAYCDAAKEWCGEFVNFGEN